MLNCKTEKKIEENSDSFYNSTISREDTSYRSSRSGTPNTDILDITNSESL